MDKINDYQKSGLGYLDCEKGQWRNGDGDIIYLSDRVGMDEDYLFNCYNFIVKEREKCVFSHGYKDPKTIEDLNNKLVEIKNEIKARGITP